MPFAGSIIPDHEREFDLAHCLTRFIVAPMESVCLRSPADIGLSAWDLVTWMSRFGISDMFASPEDG